MRITLYFCYLFIYLFILFFFFFCQISSGTNLWYVLEPSRINEGWLDSWSLYFKGWMLIIYLLQLVYFKFNMYLFDIIFLKFTASKLIINISRCAPMIEVTYLKRERERETWNLIVSLWVLNPLGSSLITNPWPSSRRRYWFIHSY